jgi:hypothetical protein
MSTLTEMRMENLLKELVSVSKSILACVERIDRELKKL